MSEFNQNKTVHFEIFKCKKCRAEYKTAEEAEECYDSHYVLGKIIGVYYTPHKKCPAKVQIELSLDGGNSFDKDVFFTIDDNGWGSK